MYLAKVIGKVISTIKHPAYLDRKMLLIQPLTPNNLPTGRITIAIDYVGAGEGDTVIISAGPGTAAEVFGYPRAPIRELIVGIVDYITVATAEHNKHNPNS
ncbi:MAG: EutN/CcmL family microcompartment protein [bacterium]|nr:EutN/CcmL family microcompartment protein [bacterium]